MVGNFTELLSHYIYKYMYIITRSWASLVLGKIRQLQSYSSYIGKNCSSFNFD